VNRLKAHFILGAATTALLLPVFSTSAKADDTLNRVLERLEKLEKENAKLRAKVNHLEEGSGGHKGDAVPAGHYVAQPLPEGSAIALAPKGAIDKKTGEVNGSPVWSFGANTTVSIYGAANLSFDYDNLAAPNLPGQGNRPWIPAISSNSTYIGFRARHDLSSYGYEGYGFVLQYEELVEASATPTERAAFGSRNSFLGVETPYGNVKIGKTDTPYKLATAAFDPFANTVADYNSIMGNTGGDNRAEFDWRMSNSIWYESPEFHGFTFSALYSPGQNYAADNSDYAFGAYTCTGANPRASGNGADFNKFIGQGQCTDGSWGDAVSVAAVYNTSIHDKDKLTVIAAYELHKDTNRNGDNLGPGVTAATDPVFVSGAHDEWAAKVGGGYTFNDRLGPLSVYGYYEWMRRESTDPAFNERTRDGFFASATQGFDDHWSASFSYAHAFKSPGNPAVGSAGLLDKNGNPYDANLFSDAAEMFGAGVYYKFNKYATWYTVGALLDQGAGGHYCLGSSGHGYQICSRDSLNNTYGGTTISAVSSGLTFNF
jgi:predicted porin